MRVVKKTKKCRSYTTILNHRDKKSFSLRTATILLISVLSLVLSGCGVDRIINLAIEKANQAKKDSQAQKAEGLANETNGSSVSGSGQGEFVRLVGIFSDGSPQEKGQLVEEIKKDPSQYDPFILYMMSETLFQNNQKDDAMFYFYAAQLRGQCDANRHKDPKVRALIDALDQKLGVPLNEYAFRDKEKLTKTLQNVLDWDKKSQNNYSTEYIGKLQKLFDVNASSELIPEDQWADSKQKTRMEYVKNFTQAIQSPNPPRGAGGLVAKMAVSLNVAKDSAKNWQVAYKTSSANSILIELTPNGENVERWDELITNTIGFGVPLESFVNTFVSDTKKAGATIKDVRKLADGSVFVSYSFKTENGMWRFIQGPDAIYGISYQTRPQTEDRARVALWTGILQEAKLIPNDPELSR